MTTDNKHILHNNIISVTVNNNFNDGFIRQYHQDNLEEMKFDVDDFFDEIFESEDLELNMSNDDIESQDIIVKKKKS